MAEILDDYVSEVATDAQCLEFAMYWPQRGLDRIAEISDKSLERYYDDAFVDAASNKRWVSFDMYHDTFLIITKKFYFVGKYPPFTDSQVAKIKRRQVRFIVAADLTVRLDF